MDYTLLGSIVLSGLCLILVLSHFKWKLIQWTGRGIVHLVIGGFLLYFTNLFGNIFDFNIPFNLVTILISGILGIPGVIALVTIKLFIV